MKYLEKKSLAFTLAEIKPSRGFCKKDVIANECEAIPNKLKDCHVAIAPRNDAKRKVAFTLAEILITLAIIGVVAAMTIPTINTKNQKRIIESRITQDFSIIQQVIRLQKVNELNMTEDIKDSDNEFMKYWFEKYWAPYMKTAKVCYDSAGCWQNKGRVKSLAGAIVGAEGREKGIGSNVVTVVLPNGSYLCIDAWPTALTMKNYFGIVTNQPPGISIYVDANGNTPPNVIGKDIYVFAYAPDVGLVPAGYSETKETINKNCSNTSTGAWAGYFCLAKIKMDSWKVLDTVWNR